MNYWIVYTLKLHDNCYYIGLTTQMAFKERMKNHWNGNAYASSFTRTHKPLRIYDIQIYPRTLESKEAEALENVQTLKIAKLFGYDRVRGGGYTQEQPNWPRNTPLTLI